MKLLIVVSCLVFAVAAKPLLGTEQCAGGPGVWCVNIRTASQCGAVKHCQQNVWNKPVLKSVPCDLCKEVMTIVENFLKDNETQTEILEYLDKACEVILPDPAMASECKELVGEYYLILLNIIVEELGNPSVACSTLHLCTSLQQHLASIKQTQLLSNEIPEMVYPFMANLPLLLTPQNKPREEPKNVDVCKDCLQLFNDIQELLKSNSSFSKMLIENALKQCDQLGGGLSEMCKNYVNQYADIFLQMMIQVPSQQICCEAGLCAQGKSAPMLEITPAKVIVPAAKLQPAVQVTEKTENVPVCEVCQVVMSQMESLLEKNSSKERIKDALDKELPPKQICTILGLCPSRQPKKVKLTAEHIQSGAACQVCKMIVKHMDQLLMKNVTQENIKRALQVVCNYLPESMADECCSIVDEYEGLFIQLLLQALDSTFVCKKLQLCPNAQKPLLGSEKCMWGPSYWCKDMETAGSCNNVEVCKDCLQLFNDIQELLKSNSSFSKMLIDNALKQCDQLGGGISEMCKNYVNQYADIFLQMMIQVPSQQICCEAGLCAQGKSAPMLEITPAKVIVPAAKLQPAVQVTEKTENVPVCEVCQVVMSQMESLLEKNSSKEQIKEALEKVCNIIPSKCCEKCREIVEMYCDAIIEMLKQEFTPKQICTMLGLCPTRQPKKVKLTAEHIQSGAACQVCKMIVKHMDQLLMENVTQENIKRALQVVCNYLPESMADECCSIVDQYEPLFIQLLLQALDSTFVCEKLKLCPNAQKQLLGSEKCMWGPSYWCKDMETAGSCNAIEHCKRHVWN
ncbi:prosaposin isoform X2 [Leptodactylus fuscus]|uniref:prosaposin isoform X2 n=1 Tax=Leptodactylus fuscus TaxID=238119 RepID=UPI003F4E6B92